MNQAAIYAAIAKAGFEVAEFHDHPSSFGSWYVVAVRGSVKRRLIFDGKEGTFSIEAPRGSDWKELKLQRVRYDSQKEIIARCEGWLIEAGA